jgi:hypothetical protein
LSIKLNINFRKRSPRQELPSLQPEKSQATPAMTERMSNPMFGDRVKSPTATAMGGIPSDLVKSRIPSPKVHPAPQPPAWPNSASSTRMKKLSWGDDKVLNNKFWSSMSFFDTMENAPL